MEMPIVPIVDGSVPAANSGYNDGERILMCHHFGAMLKFYDRQVIMREIIGALIAFAVIKILKSAIRWN